MKTIAELKQENADLRRMNELLKSQLTKALEVVCEERREQLKKGMR